MSVVGKKLEQIDRLANTFRGDLKLEKPEIQRSFLVHLSSEARNRFDLLAAMADQHSKRYDEAHVLMLGWEHDEDDNDHNKEMRDGLRKLEWVLSNFFSYRTYSEWRIPEDAPTDAVNTRLQEFKTAYNKRRNLLVVYYAGHGAVDVNRCLLWLKFDNIKGPRVEWIALQTAFLADNVADVLLIMDCCSAMGAFQLGDSYQSGTAMLWAACDRISKTPVLGPACFTVNLAAVLEDVTDEGCDVDILNNHILVRLDKITSLERLTVHSFPQIRPIRRSQDTCMIRVKRITILQGDSSAIPVPPVKAGIVAPAQTVSKDESELVEGKQRYSELGGDSTLGTLTSHSASTSNMAKQQGATTLVPEDAVMSTSQPETPTHEPNFDHNWNENTTSKDTMAHQQQADSCEEPDRVGHAKDSNPEPRRHSEGVRDVMRRLWFASADSRKHSVGAAYYTSFDWIHHDKGFLQWTKGEEPLFWVSGKPGSGKSTLMKHLLLYCSSRPMLQDWSHGTKVLTASFFFWAAGDLEGNSCVGCLRSLLFQIMNHDPDTAAYALPYFEQAPDSGCQIDPFRLHVLQDILEALTQVERSPMRTKYWCIFLDGLDECSDWQIISEIVTRILRAPHIKVCVSSRPYNFIAIELRDHHPPSLQMQDFMYDDILSSVKGQLLREQEQNRARAGGHENSQQRIEEISNLIAHRADGVFLWAALATRRVLDSLNAGRSWAVTRKAVDEIPRELAELYSSLLDVLNPETVKIFLVAQACEVDVLDIQSGTTVQPVLTATLLYSALKKSTQYALRAPIRPERMEVIAQRIDRIKRRLEHETHGLVTIDDTSGNAGAANLSYMHKTAHDFLIDYDVLHRLRESPMASKFNPHLALLRAVILDVKAQNLENSSPFTDLRFDILSSLPCWTRIEQAVKNAQVVFDQREADKMTETVQLLDELDRVVRIQLETWSEHTLQEHWSSLTPLGAAIRPTSCKDNFLSYAASCGLWQYVSYKLKAGTPLRKSGKPLLFYAIQPQPQFAGSPSITATVDVLFKHGADPNGMFLGESAWRRFLKTFYLYDADNSDTKYAEQLREIFRLFTVKGADPAVAEAVAAEVRATVD